MPKPKWHLEETDDGRFKVVMPDGTVERITSDRAAAEYLVNVAGPRADRKDEAL